MNFPPYAKAIAGSFVGALASVGTTAATTGTVDSNSVTATVVSAVAGFVLPYLVPNGKNPKDAASGLVVTVKIDVDTFLAKFVAGLPALVRSSAEAAIAPKAEAAPIVVNNYGPPKTAAQVASDLMFKMGNGPAPAADSAPAAEAAPAPEASAPSADTAPVA